MEAYLSYKLINEPSAQVSLKINLDPNGWNGDSWITLHSFQKGQICLQERSLEIRLVQA